MKKNGPLMKAMIQYYRGDVRRINHFLKVYGFAKSIGEIEELDETTQEILEIAALTHDIGIKLSEEKHNSSAGTYQQIEGPSEAMKMLTELNYETTIIERVCWLIAHHHTYDNISGLDYQILVEADFLVNAFEDGLTVASLQKVQEKIFRTRTGNLYLNTIYESFQS